MHFDLNILVIKLRMELNKIDKWYRLAGLSFDLTE